MPRSVRIARAMNVSGLLFMLVVMLVLSETARGEPAGDADAAVRQLYAHRARALRRYVERFCPDRASADDIVQETFIRAWRHLPQLSSGDFPVRPWLSRVARNLLIDAAVTRAPRGPSGDLLPGTHAREGRPPARDTGRPPAGHVHYERTGLSTRSGPWRRRHVMQVAQPPPRSAEPSPISYTS
jgi:DNA-directed RNA polymerase specialized sigma24 family protein